MAEIEKKNFTLPSGKVVTFREAKGRDLMRAQVMVGGATEPMAIIYAIVALVAAIDGQSFTYEDVLEMPLRDVMELQNGVLGENFSVPPLPASPGSSTTDSGLPN